MFKSSEGFKRTYIGFLSTAHCSKAELYDNFYGIFENMRVGNELVKVKTNNEKIYKQKYWMWGKTEIWLLELQVIISHVYSFLRLYTTFFFAISFATMRGVSKGSVLKMSKTKCHPAHTLFAIGCKILPYLNKTKLTSLTGIERLVRASDDIEFKNL